MQRIYLYIKVFLTLILTLFLVFILIIHIKKLSSYHGLLSISYEAEIPVYETLSSLLESYEIISDFAFFTREVSIAESGSRSVFGVSVYKTTKNYGEVAKLQIVSGDILLDSKSIIISRKLAIELFSNINCIGLSVEIGGKKYLVSGVYDDARFITELSAEVDNYSACILGNDLYNTCYVQTEKRFTEILYYQLEFILSEMGIVSVVHNISLYNETAVFVAQIFLALIVIMIFIYIIRRLRLYQKFFFISILVSVVLFYIICNYVIKVTPVIPATLFDGGLLQYFILMNQKTNLITFIYMLSKQALTTSLICGIFTVVCMRYFLLSVSRIFKMDKE